LQLLLLFPLKAALLESSMLVVKANVVDMVAMVALS